MAIKYTEEQLNTVDKSLIIQMFLNQQEELSKAVNQIEQLTKEVQSDNDKLQRMMEQIILSNNARFGRSSEKMDNTDQISFMEVDGNIIFFNESEAVCDLSAEEPEDLEPKPRGKKKVGKKEADMSGLPVNRVNHYMTEEELIAEFGENGWKQLPDAIKVESERCGMYYVNERWLGGMLTNFKTIKSRIARLKEIERMSEDGTFDVLPKKEVIQLKKEWEKLEKNLGGIKEMKKLPDAIFVVDPKKERICVQEAHTLGIPLIGIADTNCDPEELDYVIPGNDDAIRAVKLIVSKMADAVIEANQGMTGDEVYDEAAEEAYEEAVEE